MEAQLTALEPDTPFSFSCRPEVSCFTECCRNLNQFLTPYDLIRLKTRMGVTSREFLDKYTIVFIGPETGLPVAVLEPVGSDSRCPFVSSEGCAVYSDRPASCRTYPLVRLLSRNKDTGALSERYFIHRESHCRGFDTQTQQTLDTWVKDQELAVYNEMNDPLMDIIALKNRYYKGPLNTSIKDLFKLCCYDIDTFRERLFQKSGDKFIESVAPELAEQAEHDDIALLKIGFERVKTALLEHRRES